MVLLRAMLCVELIAAGFAVWVAVYLLAPTLSAPMAIVTLWLLWAGVRFIAHDVCLVTIHTPQASRITDLMPMLDKSERQYVPTPYLLHSNLQTLFAVMGRPDPNVRYTRERSYIVYRDGEIALFDWSLAKEPSTVVELAKLVKADSVKLDTMSNIACKPIIVVLFHGLTGGSVDSNMHYLTKIFNAHGLHVVIPVRRGCGGPESLTRPKHYAYGDVEDSVCVVDHIARTNPKALLVGLGVSAGSNVLANYLGTQGANSKLLGAVSIANGYCWERGTTAIAEHHPVWDMIMATMVHAKLFAQHTIFDTKSTVASATYDQANPEIRRSSSGVQRSMRKYDDEVSRKLHGFDTLDSFYRHQSCLHRIDQIRVPMVFMNSLDDPLVHRSVIPVETLQKNPFTALVTTNSGGHLGHAEGLWPFRRSYTWMDRFGLQAVAAVIFSSQQKHFAEYQRNNKT